MPTYIFWGNDQFRLDQAIKKLQNKVLDKTWITFNFDKIDCSSGGSNVEEAIQGLNQVVTPPMGTGGRLVWLINPSLSPQQAKDFISELERTVPVLGDESHLLLTFSQKPDGRSKTFKFLEKHASIQEFSNIPLWKTGELIKLLHKSAKSIGLKLTDEIAEYLVDAIGNDTRAIQNSLEKIQLYLQSENPQISSKGLELETVQVLIPNSAQTSLDLANALKSGDTGVALGLLESLLIQNEAPLRILATLVRQFRTWTWIKVMESSGERDNNAIAKAAEIRNPKRLYFLRKEIQALQKEQLKNCLYQLQDLELKLKQGYEAKAEMQRSFIEITQICCQTSPR